MNIYTYDTKPHGTSTYFSIIQAESNTMIQFNEKQYAMQRNDLILMKENITWKITKGKVCSINCEKQAFDTLFHSQIADCRIIHDFLFESHREKEYLYFATSKDSSSIQFLQMLKAELKQDDEYHTKMMKLYLTGLLTCLDRSRPRTLILSNSTMVSENEFGKILKYMGEHYAFCNLEDMAEKFGYHPDYLSRKFKKITGQSFHEKLLSIRMEKAEELILTTDLTIEQISAEVGFHDKSWFQKKFKETYNSTPNKYRKLHQEL